MSALQIVDRYDYIPSREYRFPRYRKQREACVQCGEKRHSALFRATAWVPCEPPFTSIYEAIECPHLLIACDRCGYQWRRGPMHKEARKS